VHCLFSDTRLFEVTYSSLSILKVLILRNYLKYRLDSESPDCSKLPSVQSRFCEYRLFEVTYSKFSILRVPIIRNYLKYSLDSQSPDSLKLSAVSLDYESPDCSKLPTVRPVALYSKSFLCRTHSSVTV
jgi:hypothetical protein